MTMAPVVIEKYKDKDPNHMPRYWFNYYVTYVYVDHDMQWKSSEFIVGFDSIDEAEKFQEDLTKKKHFATASIYGEYPLRLIKDKEIKK